MKLGGQTLVIYRMKLELCSFVTKLGWGFNPPQNPSSPPPPRLLRVNSNISQIHWILKWPLLQAKGLLYHQEVLFFRIGRPEYERSSPVLVRGPITSAEDLEFWKFWKLWKIINKKYDFQKKVGKFFWIKKTKYMWKSPVGCICVQNCMSIS